MSDLYTDDDVSTTKEAIEEWLFRMHGIVSSCDHDVEARNLLDAVAPAIAARALREDVRLSNVKALASDYSNGISEWIRNLIRAALAEPEARECICTYYPVDMSDPERYHPENMDRENDPACPEHGDRADEIDAP